MAFFISWPMALAMGGGTALPTCGDSRQLTLQHSHCNGDSCQYLSVLVKDVTKEAEGVRKSLGSCTLPHTHYSVLLWVKHSALHGERKGDGWIWNRVMEGIGGRPVFPWAQGW